MVRTIIDKANCGSGKGMRYDADWLMECLLLKIKSPAAYKHIRQVGILPLPCPSTIKRLLSSMPCKFGFNEEALSAIKRMLESLPLHLRRGSLVWDEMSITKSIKFDSQQLRFEGFVDFGSGNLDEDVDIGQGLADHALVFLFRPYRSSWIQPIAVFATKGAAPGRILSRLLIKAIAALEVVGARVTSVTCDGAQPNKTVWKHCGLTGVPDENGNVKCSMPHPTVDDEDERIWFLQDVPHLFKCIRNHIFGRRKIIKVRKQSKQEVGSCTSNSGNEKTAHLEEKIQVWEDYSIFF